MILRKGLKFKLQPNKETETKMSQFAGCCRFVVNKVLSLNDDRYLFNRFGLNVPRIPYNDAAGLLKLWKQSDEYPWLKECDSQVLQQALMQLDRGYVNCFQGRADPPTKRKKFLNDSFRYPQRFKVEGNRVYLPKIGWVKFRKSRDMEGEIKNVTVSRKGDGWFVSFQVEIEMDDPMHPSGTAVGIDLGVAQFATLSDGTVYEPLSAFRRLESKLAKLQRKLSLKVKFSNGWKKVKRKITRLHSTIADARHDYLHKVSTEISQNHAVIGVEDLKVSNMSRSAKGTVETPGRKVAQKSGLNKSILDQGWGMFRTMLEYKQLWRGGMLIAVPPHHTSQMCSQCGHISPLNRQSQSVFECVQCGFKANADWNAASNIRTLAVGQTESLNACGA